MKNLIVTLAFAVSVSASASALEGGSSSGGGNFRELEFHSRIAKLVSLLSSPEVASSSDFVSAQEIQILSTELTVEFTELSLTKDGVSKDALNFPGEKKILVSKTAWDALVAKPSQKDLLVFHELLGVLRIDDRNYRYSLKLLPLLAQHNQDHCEDELDYQLEHIEGLWAFNPSAHVLMKTTVISTGPKSIMLRVQSCDRAVYLQSQGACVPAQVGDGRVYPDFHAQYSIETGKFLAPAYFSLKVDCRDPSRLSYEQDRPDGMGLSYFLKRHN